LIEKLKMMDGPAIKDTALTKVFKEALTEELIVEGALFSWARANNIAFSDVELTKKLQEQMGISANLQSNIQGASPSLNLLRDAIYVQLIQEKLRQKLIADEPPTEQQLKLYYEKNASQFSRPKVQMKQIVVTEEAAAQTLLQNLREKKISFDAAEKKFSTVNHLTADNVAPFYEATSTHFVSQLLNAPIGLQNRIYQSPAGFHIVFVLQVGSARDSNGFIQRQINRRLFFL
jgi:hypothetical protein